MRNFFNEFIIFYKGHNLIIDNIAIPHAVQKAGDAIVLSVGVFREPMPYKNDNIQVVFLLALPEEIRDENLLSVSMMRLCPL